MTTSHVLDLLPLWVEGDLDPRDTEAVEAHLAQCPTCHAGAEALQTSQAWLRDAMAAPFDQSDRAHFRAEVMARIRAETPRPSPRRLISRPAVLAAGAAALLLATLTWHPERPRPGLEGGAAARPTPAIPSQAEIRPQESPRHAARAAPVGPPAHRTPEPNPPAGGEPARIEFQTSDPSIRIIWLAQTKPLSDATLPTQETP